MNFCGILLGTEIWFSLRGAAEDNIRRLQALISAQKLAHQAVGRDEAVLTLPAQSAGPVFFFRTQNRGKTREVFIRQIKFRPP
jgi:hypothetical protein